MYSRVKHVCHHGQVNWDKNQRKNVKLLPSPDFPRYLREDNSMPTIPLEKALASTNFDLQLKVNTTVAVFLLCVLLAGFLSPC